MIRKTIIIILITTLITGCWNYIEINDLVLISGIGIDYQNNKYEVSFETLYQDKESSDSNFEKGIIKTGTGKTLGEAFDNITLSIEKEPYFAHLKVLVISTEIANNHLDKIFDFFLRNNDIRNIFSIVIANENKPVEILSKSDNYFPVASEKIKSLLENNVYSNYISKNKYFKKVASNYLSKDQNISLTSIKLENNNLKLDDLIIFNSQKPVGKLDTNKSLILSVIDNKEPRSLFSINYPNNKTITIRIYKSKTNIKISKKEFIIENNLMAELVENSLNINLENNINQEKITKDFINKINNDTYNLINYLKENNSDVIGINNKYYRKYKKKNNSYFENTKYKVKTKLNINKKGLIFEVKNDN